MERSQHGMGGCGVCAQGLRLLQCLFQPSQWTSDKRREDHRISASDDLTIVKQEVGAGLLVRQQINILQSPQTKGTQSIYAPKDLSSLQSLETRHNCQNQCLQNPEKNIPFAPGNAVGYPCNATCKEMPSDPLSIIVNSGSGSTTCCGADDLVDS